MVGFKNILDYVIDVVVKVVAISSSPLNNAVVATAGRARRTRESEGESNLFFPVDETTETAGGRM